MVYSLAYNAGGSAVRARGIAGSGTRAVRRPRHGRIDEDRQGRVAARPCRSAQLRFPQDHHRRRARRLERVQRVLRGTGRVRGHRPAGPDHRRQGPARLRGAGDADVRRAPPGERRRHPAGHRRHRERPARHQGQGPRRAGVLAAGRTRAGSHPALLVALRDVPARVVGRHADPAAAHARRRQEGGARRGGCRLHRPQDQRICLARRAVSALARLRPGPGLSRS